jgi:glycosyltransferase involved in cell wall biosynthesis
MMDESAHQVEIQRRAASLLAASAGPLVVICLPTFNPPRELLRRQLDSLKAQTHRQWLAIIVDDSSATEAQAALRALLAGEPRFIFVAGAQRLGVYHNVERCLRLVPPQAEFVALADQDDYWYPTKLERLLARCGGQGQLAYSDMRVTRATGELLAETYWTTWRNNQTDLTALLFENTVTGAASLFRRELLQVALPFPPRVGNLYHDHWLACVALALGELNFIAEPLYDYIQHGGNDIGHRSPPRRSWLGLAQAAWQRLAHSSGRKLAHLYDEKVDKPGTLARTLLHRAGERIEPAKRAALERLAVAERSWPVAGWLLARGFRKMLRRDVGLPAEHYAVAGLLWRRWRGPVKGRV